MLRLRTVRDTISEKMLATNLNRFRLLFEDATSGCLLDEEVISWQLSATTLQLLRPLSGSFSM
jgi:hypothetical protein